MRELTDHRVEGKVHVNPVEVYDEPGSGGACHHYTIGGFHTKTNPSADAGRTDETLVHILFQNGPVGELGANGIHNEDLLAILIDRMRGFQSGPYKSRENAIALTHLEDAMMWLQKRTRERVARGVEGTHAH